MGSSTKMMQPLLVSLEKGAESASPSHSHKGETFLLMLEGKVKIAVGEREQVLKTGDSIHFKSAVPHKITNIGKTITIDSHLINNTQRIL